MLRAINLFRLFQKSFVTRTFLAFTACLFFVTAGLGGFYIHSQSKMQEEAMDEKGVLLSGILAYNARIGVFSDNQSLLKNPVKSVFDQKEVSQVAVWDFEQKCLLSVSKNRNAISLTADISKNRGFTECIDKGRPYYFEKGTFAFYWAPVILYKAKPGINDFSMADDKNNILNVIGAVEVVMDRKMMWLKSRKLVMKSMVIGLFAWLAGALIVYLLAIGITKPLKLLNDDVLNYSRQGFRGRVRVGRNDEIGRLATTFNNMAEILETRDKALKDSHGKLEKKVEARTYELVQINQKLNAEIEERQEIQKALRESELLYKGIFTSSLDTFFICDNNITMLDVNKAGCELFGYTRKEFLKLSMRDIIHPDDYPNVKQIRKAIEENGQFFSEVIHIAKDNSLIHTELRAVKYLIDDIEKIFVTVRDTSENRALQTQLIRSERLVATGRLAASVAHEINSPLQGITLLLSDMKRECEGNEAILEDFDLIKEAFGSIRTIVKKLLDLNRPGEEKKLVDVHRIIEGTIKLVHSYLLQNRIVMRYTPCHAMLAVIGSSQELSQCFMNIINNSVEAMGLLENTENFSESRREISIETSINESEKCVSVIINDTGPGIDESAFELLFEPFYTRNKKMGMGIGLAVCQGIIEEHNGVIMAENNDDGARFIIKLPMGAIS